jgi:hypothetical protein
MAELSFIKGSPERIDISELIKGAREAAEIIEDRIDPEESVWDADDEENAREDLKALAEILEEAGYTTDEDDPEDIISMLQQLDNETGGVFIEEGQLEEHARALYEDSSWPTIIADNINWQGVVDDMTNGAYETTVNNGTYWAI